MSKKIFLLSLLLLALAAAPAWGQSSPRPDAAEGVPEPDQAPPRPHRPPVRYSTPQAGTPEGRVPPSANFDDFEKLYYQKEMWNQYRRDYEKFHRPRPEPRGSGQ